MRRGLGVVRKPTWRGGGKWKIDREKKKRNGSFEREWIEGEKRTEKAKERLKDL